MTPRPTIVRQTRALQPERDALQVSKIPNGTEKADKKAIVPCLLIQELESIKQSQEMVG